MKNIGKNNRSIWYEVKVRVKSEFSIEFFQQNFPKAFLDY